MTRSGTNVVGLLSLALALGGCGANMGSSNFFSSPTATSGDAAATSLGDDDIECPSVSVRIGAATLMIGNKSPETGEPAALDVRYQGTIIRTARECNVRAGVMSMKVGIEGRIITGPAGGPGTVDVPLRIAVVQEGPSPKTILSKFARLQVAMTGATDRVTFSHVDPDISFPMPASVADIDSYVVYVGFDSASAPPAKKPAGKRQPVAKPKGANPKQS